MKKRNSVLKTLTLTCVMCLCMVLYGCGQKTDPELEAYKESMTSFYADLSSYNNSINTIDPDSETAKDELLDNIDRMTETYKEMALVEVPEEFSGIADLADEAAEYMEKAQEFYHEAYDNEFDEDSEMLASEYYERANNRAMVMLQVLHGEVPEGEGITVETESTYEISTIPTDDEGE